MEEMSVPILVTILLVRHGTLVAQEIPRAEVPQPQLARAE